MSDIITNPLLKLSYNYIHFDENLKENIKITQKNISLYYNKIFFLIKKSNIKIPIDFYEINISKKLFENISNNLILYEMPIKIVQNILHFNNIIMVSNNYLEKYNVFNYNLQNENLVIPILNIEYSNLLLYFNQFNNNELIIIIKLIILNDYFQNKICNNYLTNLILNLEESNYWTYSHNKLINLTL